MVRAPSSIARAQSTQVQLIRLKDVIECWLPKEEEKF
jgi:hypothetical protein